MIDRKKLPRGITAAGRAVWPKLNEPDTKFKEEGEFSVKLELSGEAAENMKSTIREFATKAYSIECEDKGKKKLKKADLPFKQATDQDGEDIADTFLFNFKRKASGTTKAGKAWQATVTLFDSQKKKVTAEVWGGSKLRVAYTLVPWYNPTLGFGIKLELGAVQVLDLVTRGERSASDYGFEEEADGYQGSFDDVQPPTVDDSGSEGAGASEF